MKIFVKLLFIIGIITTVAGECVFPCIKANCNRNGVCKCPLGYRDAGKTYCLPKCDECGTGECVRPNVCKCLNSELTCTSASCTENNTCECIEGFKFSNSNQTYCEPTCKDACKNGKCSDDFKECICDDGLELDEDGNCYKTKRNVVCKKNYTYSEIYKKCRPDCKIECGIIGGKCIAPNICECEPKCISGQCVNGKCDCDLGFILRNNSLNECVPDCESNCHNGVCNQIGICECNNGYIKINNECSKIPHDKICKRECVNAKCIGSNNCACNSGYHFCWNNGTRCENIYIQTGVLSEGDSCTPKCTPSCKNGYCIKPNICECFNGYKMDGFNNCVDKNEQAKTRLRNPDDPKNIDCPDGYRRGNDKGCIPKCDECGNGNCIKPNICQCLHTQIKCTNASCTDDNKCICFERHTFEDNGMNTTCKLIVPRRDDEEEMNTTIDPIVITSTTEILKHDNNDQNSTKNPSRITTKQKPPVCNSSNMTNKGDCENKKDENIGENKTNKEIIIILILIVALFFITGVTVLFKKVRNLRKSNVWSNPEIKFTTSSKQKDSPLIS